jgi:CDP-2,3-bis-(O-geranylgeranyl)-sn-glycerol synthase
MLNELWDPARALILLVVANGAPVVGTLILGDRFGGALDRGRHFADGRPIFGPAKTIRGVLLSLAATSVAALLLGFAWPVGLLFGVLAMVGDLLSSFTKRRLGIAPSGRALGLDQIPESLLPLLVCRTALGLSYVEVALLIAAFFVFDLALSRLYRPSWREQTR